MSEFRSGYASIIGRPNVGKSTLINKLVGFKVAITVDRPQTTRNRILGIKDRPDAQIVYIDTPGIHKTNKRVFNRMMNRAVSASLEDVDVALFLIEASGWTEQDAMALEVLKNHKVPAILVINKIDKLKQKSRLLPLIEAVSKKHDFIEIIPVSAKTGNNVDALEQLIVQRLPAGEPIFPPGQITNQSDMFFAAELVREQLSRRLYHELPHKTAVMIEAWEDKSELLKINAVIWVEKPGQKAIIIGNRGEHIKQVGMAARKELEETFGKKVYLGLWVKVRPDWSENPNSLKDLGYLD